MFVQCLRSDFSCFGHYNRSCLLAYYQTVKKSWRFLHFDAIPARDGQTDTLLSQRPGSCLHAVAYDAVVTCDDLVVSWGQLLRTLCRLAVSGEVNCERRSEKFAYTLHRCLSTGNDPGGWGEEHDTPMASSLRNALTDIHQPKICVFLFLCKFTLRSKKTPTHIFFHISMWDV